MEEQRAQLSRTLKPHWVWAIALGSAVGWGAFVLPVDWMSTAGPVGAMLGFTAGGVLMLIIAVSYGLLIRNFPVSGGEFAYSYLGFGRDQAFVCGWFLTLGYMSIVALNASALALLAKFVLPGIAERGLMYTIAGWEVYFGEVVIASIALIVFAWMNIRGATLSGRMQFIFCVVLIAGVVLVAVGAFLHPDTSLGNATPLVNPKVPAISAILAIVAIAPWAYVGFDNVPQAAEEFDFSAAKAFRLIVFALVAATLVYSATIFATAVSVPWQELVASEPVWGTGENPAERFLKAPSEVQHPVRRYRLHLYRHPDRPLVRTGGPPVDRRHVRRGRYDCILLRVLRGVQAIPLVAGRFIQHSRREPSEYGVAGEEGVELAGCLERIVIPRSTSHTGCARVLGARVLDRPDRLDRARNSLLPF